MTSLLVDRKTRQRFFFCLGVALMSGPFWIGGAMGWTLLALGFYVLFIPGRGAIPVLAYHSVNPDREWMGAPDLVVSPALFARQMVWLKDRGYKTLWMDELLAVKRAKNAGLFVAIHFDDGYLDAMTQVAPVLRLYGLKGTVFVSPGLLRDGPVHERLAVRNDLCARRFLSPGDLQKLSFENVLEIQAHGWTHREMPTLSSVVVRMEMNESKRFLSSLLQHEVRHICFPRDARDRSTVTAALEAGYIGYTGGKGRNTPNEPPGEVSRVYITESGCTALDMLSFKADILLFRGVYAFWPLRAACKAFIRQRWRLDTRQRITP